MKVYLVKFCSFYYDCDWSEIRDAYFDRDAAEKACAAMNESNPYDLEWYEIQGVEVK